jgi:small neutral amino acid transporter SnatA (MarC family)
LVTVLLFSSNSAKETVLHIGVLSLVAVIRLIVLLSAERVQRVLGPRVMTSFESLIGLILTAMAVETLPAGIRAYVKSLA